MSFIFPILRFFNVIPSTVISKKHAFTQDQTLATQTKITSIVLLILQYLKLLPSHQKNRVRFKGLITQVLIPTRKEYYKETFEGERKDSITIGDMLWYDKEEKADFKAESIAEVKAYARENGMTSFREARDFFYSLELENYVNEATWKNSQVTELSTEIFKKKFKKESFVHTFPLNIQISKENTSQTFS